MGRVVYETRRPGDGKSEIIFGRDHIAVGDEIILHFSFGKMILFGIHIKYIKNVQVSCLGENDQD